MFTNEYQENECSRRIGDNCKDNCPLIVSRDGKCTKYYSYDKERKEWVKDENTT